MTALTDAEYVLSSVALGIDEYYAGVGEAPGSWAGSWARSLGIEGMVEADELRSLVDGLHPLTGEPLLGGSKPRTVKAFDLTFSAPKSVSLLWALGSDAIAETVMAAHRQALATALGFLEERAATARQQIGGVRRHVATEGWAVAMFGHRTSREGDPQVHTHCVVPNVVQRSTDGRRVALAARPLFVWARAAGSIYQAALQHELTVRLGVEWQADRHNTREMVGFSREQLRVFSKRTLQVEAELEARGARYESPVLRARADDEASLATRARKDHRATPAMLQGRWDGEAVAIGLSVGPGLDDRVAGLQQRLERWSFDEIARALVDEEIGVCAHSPRFTEPDVVEHVAAWSGGRLTTADIEAVTAQFLGSDLVVALVPTKSVSGWEPARWSTRAHRQLEDATMALLDTVMSRPAEVVGAPAVAAALAESDHLGGDQRRAVEVLCGPGGSVRTVLAPAGYGKTAMVHAAAAAAATDGRPVLAVATTAKAVAELTEAGLPAVTIARFRADRIGQVMAAGTVVVLDEVSQTSTRDAYTVLAAVAGCPEAQLWVLGDPRQAPAVKAGGIAAELERRAETGAVPAARLTVNRRQVDTADRRALAVLRAGDGFSSQAIRADHGWEHQAANPVHTRQAMADAVATDLLANGPGSTAALVVSHGQAEDLADRIRTRLAAAGWLSGPVVTGPGWTDDRHYQAGDRLLCHSRHGGLVNGSVVTVTAITGAGVVGQDDHGSDVVLSTAFVTGARPDGSPNVSHAWARTVDGAQGGTWDHAHLLGTPALDTYRGYTGQSRARHPTHTWNTTPLVELDVGGVPVERGDPDDQVAAALSRAPDVTFAATDDPWVIHDRLVAEIMAHEAVLATKPPNRERELQAAHARQGAAERELDEATAHAKDLGDRLDGMGALARWRPKGRAQIDRLETALDHAHDRAAAAAGEVARVSEQVKRLEGDQAAHENFDRRQGWRRDAITSCDERLGEHWTEVALACIAADRPLAFGPEPLRRARHHLDSQLAGLCEERATGTEVERLALRLELVDGVLDRTRPQRVLQAMEHPARWQTDILGPIPTGSAGRAVWCDAAYRLEQHLDRTAKNDSGWAHLCEELRDTAELCQLADARLWLPTDAVTPAQWSRAASDVVAYRDEVADHTGIEFEL